jgi:hypothetical protein
MAFGHGGKRRGAGRPVGGHKKEPTPLKNPRAIYDMMGEAKKLKGAEFAPTPLEYMLSLLWRPETPRDLKFAAAKDSLPYTSSKWRAISMVHKSPPMVVEFVDYQNRIATNSTTTTPVITASGLRPSDRSAVGAQNAA